MSLIRRYGPSFGLPVAGTMGIIALEASCDVLQPTILSRVLDQAIPSGQLSAVWADTGLMLAVAGAGAVFALGRNVLSVRVSQALGARLRSDLFGTILARPPAQAARDDTDSLLIRLTNDVSQLQTFVNGVMRVFFKAPFLAVMAIVMATLLDWQFALLLGVIVPLVATAQAWTIRRGFGRFLRVQEALDRLNAVFRQFLTGIRVIKAFDREGTERERFHEAAQRLAAANSEALWFVTRVGPLVGLLVNLGIVAALSLAAGPSHQSFHAGKLIAFVNYMTQILFSLLLVTAIANSFVRAQASALRVDEVLDSPTEAPAAEAGTPAPSGALGVEFRSVDFGWSGRQPAALRRLDLSIEPGEFIGLLGATGSGKTTLVQLACGIQTPSAGTVTVGGVTVSGSEGALVRSRIAVVPQRTNLFSGTLRSNLLWGKADATESELEAACAASAALEFVRSFPAGWDTPVGRGGVTLSGGQRQRLSLARALLRDPDLLVLDDATSAVDTLTEAQILDALRHLPRRPTVLLVAQRAGAFALADRILVLDAGTIAGFDTPEALGTSCTVYRDILRSQTGLEADHV